MISFLKKPGTFLLLTFIFVQFFTNVLLAQAGTYYNGISPGAPTFITDLETRIRSPYTQISYDQFDETYVTHYASRDTTNGQRVVTCVYSGENYVYSPPFTWAVFSREHTWCQSWMPSGGSTSTPEGSDQHHLFPVDQNHANIQRSNHPLGTVVNVTSTYLGWKLGTDANGYTVFEPRDHHKGDAARALLYMSVRYNGILGYDWSFNRLQTILDSLNEGHIDLNTLLAWNKQDPPDRWEVERNNYIQSIQQNRNPFVDHPEWVNYINFNDLSKLNPVYAAEPTNYPVNFSAVSTGSNITVTWNDAAAGSQIPSGYLLTAFDNNNYVLPIDGETYADDINLSDGRATVNIPYGIDTYSFSGLVANTHYYFVIYSYYGSGSQINYKIDGTFPQANAVFGGAPITEPTVQASNILFSSITSAGMTLNWTPGNGTSRIVLAHAGAPVNSDPVDFTSYTSNPVFGTGSQIGTGNFVVSNGASNTAIITGLNSNTTYYFKVYEYNGSGGTENYLTTSPASANQATLPVTEPTLQTSSLMFSVITSTQMNLSWTNGNGTSRIVVAHSGSVVNSDPVDGVTYTPNSVFGSGSQIGTNNFVVFSGPGNSVTVSGLTPSTAYYFSVYEFNGSGGSENYLTTSPATGNQVTAVVSTVNHITIEEIYGGGGNSGSVYKNDYIVLYNPTASAVSLNGWSVQYASATGTFSTSNRTLLTGTIQPGSFYLIQEAAGSGGTTSLPTANVIGTIAMAATAGKVALSKGTTAISGKSDANVVDFVGYGSTANEYEGSGPTPAPSNTTSVQRKNNGGQDTDDNSVDFAVVTPDLGNLSLPVQLVSFNADSKGRQVNLKWKTATELNSFGFEVQRNKITSSGSGDWIVIGFINSHMNSNTPNEYLFADKNAESGKYNYRLKMIDRDGSYKFTDLVSAEVSLPEKFDLLQNYPNPFNPTTIISYNLPYDSNVKLSLYDIAGRLVNELVKGTITAGYHEYNFNAGNLSSGVYFYTISAASITGSQSFHSAKKLLLLK